jgi:hypothetical protein
MIEEQDMMEEVTAIKPAVPAEGADPEQRLHELEAEAAIHCGTMLAGLEMKGRGAAQEESAAASLARVLHAISAEDLPQKVHRSNFRVYVQVHLLPHMEALFPDLKRERLSWQQAYRYRQEGEVLAGLDPIFAQLGENFPRPTSERQLRALIPLRKEPEQALKAWRRVVDQEGPDPSGTAVEKAVAVIVPSVVRAKEERAGQRAERAARNGGTRETGKPAADSSREGVKLAEWWETDLPDEDAEPEVWEAWAKASAASLEAARGPRAACWLAWGIVNDERTNPQTRDRLRKLALHNGSKPRGREKPAESEDAADECSGAPEQ